MHARALLLVIGSLLSPLAGCAPHPAPPAVVVASAGGSHAPLTLFCLRNVSSLEVREVDLHDGAELRLAADESERRELVRLVERFVALDAESRAASGPDAPHFAAPGALIHHVHLSAIEDARGVELVAETEPAHVDEVRAELREDARELAAGECPAALQVVL